MIRLPDKSLSQGTLDALAGYQREIALKPSYTERVDEAQRIWPLRKQNVPFKEVKHTLTEMCSGAKRCCYCEDSMADEIEHIWPKVFYPEKTFLWENYLYACGPCNGPKGSKFAVFTGASSGITVLSRSPGQAVVQPPPGQSMLIDPRRENPMDFLWLDINDSFMFTPIDDDPNELAHQRAKYTIDVLKLNSRDDLVKARRSAYGNYRARIKEYIQQKNNGAYPAALTELKDNLQTEHHPTVWKEMQRQQSRIAELNKLFKQAPEMRNWW